MPEYQIPGGPYVNETDTFEAQLPGGPYVNETVAGNPPVSSFRAAWARNANAIITGTIR
jgi:hypothetical protein